MARKVTLERLLEKVPHKELFYLDDIRKASLNTMRVFKQYEDKVRALDFEKQYDILDALNTYFLGYAAENSIISIAREWNALQYIRHLKEHIGEPELKPELKNIKQEELEALYYNYVLINYMVEWCGAPAKNGKPNFYSIFSKYEQEYFAYNHWYGLVSKPLTHNGKKMPKQVFFEYLKESILSLLNQSIRLQEESSRDKTKDMEVEVRALTWSIISDRHTPEAEPEAKNPPRDRQAIKTMAGCKPFDWISSLMPTGQRVETDKSFIVCFENAELKAWCEIPKEASIEPFFDVFMDKFLLLCRSELNSVANVNSTNKPVRIDMTLDDIMVEFGYSPEQIKDKFARYRLKQKIEMAFKTWYSIDVQELHGNKSRFRMISGYAVEKSIKATFTTDFLECQQLSHVFEHYTSSLLSFGEDKVVEYYILRKLINIYDNRSNLQRRELGKLSVKALVKELEGKGALGKDTSRHAERRKINRLIKAFKWLQENDYIEYDFYDGEQILIDEDIDEYYSKDLPTLKTLMTCYVVCGLVDFENARREEYKKLEATQKNKGKSRRKAKITTIDVEAQEVKPDIKEEYLSYSK